MMSQGPLMFILWGLVFKLSHLKYCAGVACGGKGLYLCVVCVRGVLSVSIDSFSMALRSN